MTFCWKAPYTVSNLTEHYQLKVSKYLVYVLGLIHVLNSYTRHNQILCQYHSAVIIHVLCKYICHYRQILLSKSYCYFHPQQITCSNHGHFFEIFILLLHFLVLQLLAVGYGGSISPL